MRIALCIAGTVGLTLGLHGSLHGSDLLAPIIEYIDTSRFPQVLVRLSPGTSAGPEPYEAPPSIPLRENGVAAKSIPAAPERAPVWVSLVVDRSQATRAGFADVVSATLDLVNTLPGGTRVSLIASPAENDRAPNFSADRRDWREAVQGLAVSGMPDLAGSLDSALRLLETVRSGRRVVVAFSAGRSAASGRGVNVKQLVLRARRNGIPIYVVVKWPAAKTARAAARYRAPAAIQLARNSEPPAVKPSPEGPAPAPSGPPVAVGPPTATGDAAGKPAGSGRVVDRVQELVGKVRAYGGE
jgi:hypothetical protein